MVYFNENKKIHVFSFGRSIWNKIVCLKQLSNAALKKNMLIVKIVY